MTRVVLLVLFGVFGVIVFLTSIDYNQYQAEIVCLTMRSMLFPK